MKKLLLLVTLACVLNVNAQNMNPEDQYIKDKIERTKICHTMSRITQEVLIQKTYGYTDKGITIGLWQKLVGEGITIDQPEFYQLVHQIFEKGGDAEVRAYQMFQNCMSVKNI